VAVLAELTKGSQETMVALAVALEQ